MKKIVLLTAAILILVSGMASAEEFSLYGVKMGMTETELETHWNKLDDNQYIIEGSTLLNILPEFDHRQRLYKLRFSTPIPLLDQYPGAYATSAFQELAQKRWEDPDLIVSLRTGRGIADISLTSRSLDQEFAEHVKVQMQVHLSTLLKP